MVISPPRFAPERLIPGMIAKGIIAYSKAIREYGILTGSIGFFIL